MKLSDQQINEVVDIVKFHFSGKWSQSIKEFEQDLKAVNDPDMVYGTVYLTLMQRIKSHLYGNRKCSFIGKL